MTAPQLASYLAESKRLRDQASKTPWSHADGWLDTPDEICVMEDKRDNPDDPKGDADLALICHAVNNAAAVDAILLRLVAERAKAQHMVELFDGSENGDDARQMVCLIDYILNGNGPEGTET